MIEKIKNLVEEINNLSANNKEELEQTLDQLKIERTTRVEELEFNDILKLLEVVKLK